MRIYHQIGGMVWLLFAAAVMYESVSLGIGTARMPGSGFITFVASGMLGILSLWHLIDVSLRRPGDWMGPKKPLARLPSVAPAFMTLILYALILPWLGYGVATFLLMLVLFFLAQPTRRVAVPVAAFLATAITQIVFQVLLKSQFPTGPWGF